MNYKLNNEYEHISNILNEIIDEAYLLYEFILSANFTLTDETEIDFNDGVCDQLNHNNGKDNRPSHEIISHDQGVKLVGRVQDDNSNVKSKNVVTKSKSKPNLELNQNPLFQINSKKPRNPEPVIKTCDNKNSIRVGVMNPGSLNTAKSKVISNICSINDLNVLVVSETGASGTQIPKINSSFKAF